MHPAEEPQDQLDVEHLKLQHPSDRLATQTAETGADPTQAGNSQHVKVSQHNQQRKLVAVKPRQCIPVKESIGAAP